MRANGKGTKWLLATFLALSAFAVTIAAQHISSLVVSGQSGQANVVQVQGRNYVSVEDLARIANGSISFRNNQIVLTLAGSSTVSSDALSATQSAPPPGFSRDFLNAAIESMSQLREWHAALKNAVEHGFKISDDWIAPFRRESQQNLRFAGAAVSTDIDRKVYPFLNNEFDTMNKLSDQYLARSANLTYIDPNSLNGNPLEQKLVNCGHALSAMAGANQFIDNGACQ